jgi:glutaredoxin
MQPCVRYHPTAVSQAAFALALALFALPGHAQFKVIGADGKVTYTDREPSASEGKVVPIGSKAVVAQPATAAAAEPELPFELRQATSKYPVTLYVTSTACEPCNSGRQMLKSRGIPFNEKIIITAEDSEALERLSGAREAPTLAVGSQIARGYATEIWASYLDAAGYPRESRLPSTYQYRAAAPVVDRRAQATPGAESRAETRSLPTAPPAAPPPTGIRF